MPYFCFKKKIRVDPCNRGVPDKSRGLMGCFRGSCLSLAFPSLIHLVEDIAPKRSVLGLLAEAHLVALDVLWVDQTCLCSLRHCLELLAISDFSGTWFGTAGTVGGAVVDTRGSAMCKADFVFLGDLAVDCLHRE